MIVIIHKLKSLRIQWICHHYSCEGWIFFLHFWKKEGWGFHSTMMLSGELKAGLTGGFILYQ